MRRMAREEVFLPACRREHQSRRRSGVLESQDNVTVVAIVCDRGDRYLSTGVYS